MRTISAILLLALAVLLSGCCSTNPTPYSGVAVRDTTLQHEGSGPMNPWQGPNWFGPWYSADGHLVLWRDSTRWHDSTRVHDSTAFGGWRYHYKDSTRIRDSIPYSGVAETPPRPWYERWMLGTWPALVVVAVLLFLVVVLKR